MVIICRMCHGLWGINDTHTHTDLLEHYISVLNFLVRENIDAFDLLRGYLIAMKNPTGSGIGSGPLVGLIKSILFSIDFWWFKWNSNSYSRIYQMNKACWNWLLATPPSFKTSPILLDCLRCAESGHWFVPNCPLQYTIRSPIRDSTGITRLIHACVCVCVCICTMSSVQLCISIFLFFFFLLLSLFYCCCCCCCCCCCVVFEMQFCCTTTKTNWFVCCVRVLKASQSQNLQFFLDESGDSVNVSIETRSKKRKDFPYMIAIFPFSFSSLVFESNLTCAFLVEN